MKTSIGNAKILLANTYRKLKFFKISQKLPFTTNPIDLIRKKAFKEQPINKQPSNMIGELK